MANKRMFNLSVISTDAFLEMPCSTQALYFHLCMRADDDGFVGSPKVITRTVGASDDDFKLLIAKRFILIFEDGVIVIKHWRMHNTISRNRYTETAYIEDKQLLKVKSNNAYTLGDGQEIDDAKKIEASKRQLDDRRTKDVRKTYERRAEDAQKTPQNRIDKNSIGKNSIDKDSIGEYEGETPTPAPKEAKHTYGEYKHVKLTDTEITRLNNAIGGELTQACITYLDEYIEMKGYKAKNHYLCIKKWVIDAVQERQPKQRQGTKAQELSSFYETASKWAESED